MGRYEVNPDFIQYLHEAEDGDVMAYVGVGDHSTKITIPKGPEAKLIIDRLRHSNR
jgi:hypothetical protein